jgi:trimeric autotransporter adhesin
MNSHGVIGLTLVSTLAALGLLALTATPAFAASQTLKVKVTGPGSISANEGTISGCTESGGASCQGEYTESAKVTLTAVPTERSTFAGWSGACSGTGACEVTMSAAEEVEAKFTAIPQEILTVANPGTGLGAGTITGGTGGEFTPIECGNGAETCTAEYDKGAAVTLTANPDERSSFASWSGCESVSGTECTVTMSTTKSVEAHFTAIPQQTLSVAVEGSGTVFTFPGPEFTPIECGNGPTTCEAHYNEAAAITLYASSAEDNHFAEWEAGPCAGELTPECTVTMSAAESVKAKFLPTFHTLSVTRPGSGTITSSLPGIDCGATCEHEFQEGSHVTLTAHAAPHSQILAWSGRCAEEPSPTECEVVIGESNVNVTAEFGPIPHTLLLTPVGGGVVSAASGAISACARGGGVCAGQYDEGSMVTLTASPFAHSNFHAWTGCTHPSDNTCEVEIGPSTTEVGAEFTPNKHTLTLSPTGPGSVTAGSGSIRGCESSGGNCAGEYIEGSTLILTATPAPHEAVAWNGCTQSDGNTCEVEIGASDFEVKATFAQIVHALIITKAGTGQGTIACNGAPCASNYPEGTVLTLAATPASGSTFAGWSGAGCSGTGTCKVTLEADTTLTATLTANPPPLAEKKCVVPQLAGRTLAQAKAALSAAQCTLGAVTNPKPKEHRKLGPLVVKSSSPAAGTTLPAGSQVDLTLGPKPKKKKKK